MPVIARIKGGARFIDGNWRAIIHVWDNDECQGEPVEFIHLDRFNTEAEALVRYHETKKPLLQSLSKSFHVTKNEINEDIPH